LMTRLRPIVRKGRDIKMATRKFLPRPRPSHDACDKDQIILLILRTLGMMALSLACVMAALQPFLADMEPVMYRVIERKSSTGSAGL